MTNDGVHLEDCQTNVIGLTELTGLKWRFYVTPQDSQQQNASTSAIDPTDPIVQAYGRCLNKGHVCTYRRNGTKNELWVFWYAEADFESITELTNGLEESDAVDLDGIPYETRVIFFEALHTKLEVSLRKNGYVRIGKWFASPVELPFLGHRELIAEHMPVFNFHFQVYGENFVAAILSVQRHIPLSWLTKAHFGRQKQAVILGPNGMKGTLVGHASAAEPIDKHFEEWQHIHGVLPVVGGLPKMVIVEINGVKMLYPTSFVCVVQDENLLIKEIDKYHEEEAKVRRDMSGLMVSLMAFEEAVVFDGGNSSSEQAESELDINNINCSQPGSTCYCNLCRNIRETDNKFDLTPEAIKPTTSFAPGGILFQNDKPSFSRLPASQKLEEELKAIDAQLKAKGNTWHMTDNFEGFSKEKSLDSVQKDILTGIEKFGECKDSPQIPDLLDHRNSDSDDVKSTENSSKENNGLKLYKSAQDLIASCEELLINRVGESYPTVDPLKVKNTVGKTSKKKAVCFPAIVTSDLDDMTCDDKSLTLMRVGTDDLSIDMSPASLDDTSEPAYRHELVTSSAPSSSSAAPPRLYPEVVQPTLLSPPVSNERCEPEQNVKAAAPTPSQQMLATLKVKDDASRVQGENMRSILPKNNRYMRAAIERKKTERQADAYKTLSDKYLKHLCYPHRSAKSETPLAVHFRRLTTKLDGMKKVVPEKELQWFEKEFRPRPQVPTTNYPPRYQQQMNRPHHFHPYFNSQRMGPMGPPGHPSHPHPMQMRPHIYNMMQQGNGPQQAGMMPPHWNPHQQMRQSPAYMNSPTYMGAMGQMGTVPNPSTFSPSYGNFQNNRSNYMATPPHRAALPSPSPGPTAAGTPATPGSMQPASTVFSPPPSSVPSVPAVSSVKPAHETNSEVTKALAIAVQLKDTVLNVHFDAGFEACPMCGCQGNIFGRDSAYITAVQPVPGKEATYWSGLYNNNQGVRCACAFSAVRHRFLCFNAGLFPEDAREATGITPPMQNSLAWFSESEKDHHLMNLVRQMSLTTELQIADARMLKEEIEDKQNRYTVSEIEKSEYLTAMRRAFGGNSQNADLLHPWAIQLEAKPSKESEWIGQREDIQTIIDLVKEEVRGKDLNDDYGPMTWRQLSSKVARRSEINLNRHLAEPIPNLIAGCEREHMHRYPKDPKEAHTLKEKEKIRDHIFPVSVAPTALRHWTSMQLMPYNEPKNVMYIGVCPDSHQIEMKAKVFLENLSIVYENCQLGRHIKFISDDTPDGMLRMIKPNSMQQTDNRVQSYADCFETQILSLFHNHEGNFEKRAFHHAAAKKPPPPPMEPPAAASPFIDPSPGSSHDMPHLLDPNGQPHPVQPPPMPRLLNITEDTYNPEDEIELLPHMVVIYVINPFTFGTHKRDAQYSRDATMALMCSFNHVINHVQPNHRIHLQLEIVDVHKVLNLNTDLPDVDASQPGIYEHLRDTAFRVYSQPRTLFASHAAELLLKSMTAFGLRSRIDISMTPVRSEFFSVPSNPYILSRPPLINPGPKDDKLAVLNLEEKVIFISYCLLGHNWLIVAATDGQGKLLDNGIINLTTSPNARYTQAKTQILEAMGRLWQYIMGVLSSDVKSWRVVINRLGRIGHGEFKAWAHLLSKSNLQRYCSTLKEKCKTCNGGAGYKDSPMILSACLVSLEPEAFFRVIPTATKKSADPISSTHIMVFPNTSYLQTEQHHELEKGMDFDNIDFLDENDEDVTEALIMGVGMSDDGQKNQGRLQRTDYFNADATDVVICNQPLATGYYVSTAPAADLPDWFWTSCPSARYRSTTHLRSSLHLTVSNSQSEEMTLKEATHPLEANATEDVLRFVLESFNALSWLNVDFTTGDRRSCLPIHIQALLRFYHNVSKLDVT